MSLSDISSDSIALMLEYLDGVAISRLLGTGSSLLKLKIRQVCKAVCVRGWPFMRIPFSLFSLPRLECLLIKRKQGISFYPWKLNGELPLPPMPAMCLTTLSMHCAQSFSVLSHEDGVPLLQTSFPNLRSLLLTGSTVLLQEKHLEALPAGLIALKLDTIHLPGSTPPSIRCSTLNKLPRQLEKLKLPTARILVDEDSHTYDSLIWPIHLRSLRLYKVDPSMMYHLPPSIEKLEIHLKPSDNSRVEMPIPTDVLPLSLIKVYISVRTNSLRPSLVVVFHPTTFPPNLKACHLPFDFEATCADDWTHLPKSIRTMTISKEFAIKCPIHAYLPNLEQIDGIYEYTDELLENLPQNLLELYTSASIEQVSHIPPKIQGLGIKIRPAIHLPYGLSTFDMSRLPLSLQRLELGSATIDTRFSKIDFGFLPRNLQYLGFGLKDIEDTETLLALPKALKSLSVASTKEADLRLNLRLLEYFPTGLTALTLNIEVEDVPWQDWMDTIEKWTHLEELHIFPAWNLIIPPVNMNVLLKLPISLKVAHLPCFDSVLKPEHMARLPKALHTLIIQYGHISSFTASDECFAKIPSSLNQIHLSSVTKGLTPKLFEILPPTVIEFSGPEDLLEGRLSDFFARNWEGYRW
jgi:hypothetical protein